MGEKHSRERISLFIYYIQEFFIFFIYEIITVIGNRKTTMQSCIWYFWMRKRHLTQSYIATCFKGYSWRGIDDGHWRLLKDLHENAKSVIKWEGNISQPFQVNQGVKQGGILTDTCFIQKIYAPSSSLLQGKHLPFTPSPLCLDIFRLFVILSLTQLYRYTPEIFLFSTCHI